MRELDEITRQVRQCTSCRLAEGRTMAVPGEGPDSVRIMFVGEAPGFHEDQQGRPFVGAAGQFLEKLLASINLSRREVYICNVIKCRPPSNRDPLPDELATCRPYLDQQIALIKPKVIVTLGRFSMELAFSGVSISRVHGIPKKIGDIVYFPMFHPAAALHQPKFRTFIESDMLKIPQILADLQAIEPEQTKPEAPTQLSLF
jgi:uracil-DNA glycosylase